ncbi:MAG: hypothetical protein ACRCZI_13075 [Cetobacterium sp.]
MGEYCIDISIKDINIDTKYLFQTRLIDEFLYRLNKDIYIDESIPKLTSYGSPPINIPNSKVTKNEVITDSDSDHFMRGGFDIFIENESDLFVKSNSDSFIDTEGSLIHNYNEKRQNNINFILKNVYNAEYVDYDWIVTSYYLSYLYNNFINTNRLKIRQLFVHNARSSISACHHLFYNSTISDKFAVDWEWKVIRLNDYKNEEIFPMEEYSESSPSLLTNNLRSTSSRILDTYNNLAQKLNKNIDEFYEDNVISLEGELFVIKNLNKIIEAFETKINYLMIDNIFDLGIKPHIFYSILILKFVDITSIVYIELPDINLWDTKTFNIILLYCLMFKSVKIYKYNIAAEKIIMVCINKKPNNSEALYKKFVMLFENTSFTKSHNLFSSELFSNDVIKNWFNNLKKNIIVDTEITSVIVLNRISDILKVNTTTF